MLSQVVIVSTISTGLLVPSLQLYGCYTYLHVSYQLINQHRAVTSLLNLYSMRHPAAGPLCRSWYTGISGALRISSQSHKRYCYRYRFGLLHLSSHAVSQAHPDTEAFICGSCRLLRHPHAELATFSSSFRSMAPREQMLMKSGRVRASTLARSVSGSC